jgi:hypothetical protein
MRYIMRFIDTLLIIARNNLLYIIENKDFIEAVFDKKDAVDAYMDNHPARDICRIRDMERAVYPLYILEEQYGVFKYMKSRDEIVYYMTRLRFDNIKLKKRAICKIDACLNTKTEVVEDELFPIYVIFESFSSGKPNVDQMEFLPHAHISVDDYKRILKTKSLDYLFDPLSRL